MFKHALLLSAGLASAGASLAQITAAVPVPVLTLTQEQTQQLMLRQMQMMAALFDYRRAQLGFDETVAAIAANASQRGWSAPQIHDVQDAMRQAGASNGKRMKTVATCPNQANERLARASGGELPPLPCRYTVFEGQDGRAYVTRMNTPMLAKGLQGNAAMVMLDIAAEEEAMLKGLLE